MRNVTAIITLFVFSITAAAVDVGFGRADITPDTSAHEVPMAGYGAREGKPSTGIHDALYAKAMVMRDGDRQWALVALDLRSVTPELKNAAIENVQSPGFDTSNVLICASHSHSGPSFYPQPFWQAQFGKYDPEILPPMAAAIAQAIDAAYADLAPAKVSFGQERIEDATRNRRWGYDTDAREAAGEEPALNPVLSVLRVDDMSGHVRGLFVHFATHPTILGHENMDLSAEWPGALQRELERAFPGATVLYANGAEGDQSPAGAEGEDDFDRVEFYGQRLAREAKGIAASIARNEPAKSIGYSLITPGLPELTFSEGAKSGPYAHMEPMAREALPKQATLQALRVDGLVLVGLPGEPICEVGLASEAALRDAGAEHALVIGLANDYIGYIVNEKEYAHGGYEVDMRSYYGPGLGDFIAKHAGEAAAKALGE